MSQDIGAVGRRQFVNEHRSIPSFASSLIPLAIPI